MKRLIKIIFLISLAINWSACDKISGLYKDLGNNVNGNNDTVRKVLLEDFTGHTCVNCPQANKIGEDLLKLYGKQLIIVGVHANFFAKPIPAPYDYDFRTVAGEEYYTFFGVSTNPIGMVNRVKQNNGAFLVEKGSYASEISKLLDSLSKKPDLYISLKPTFSISDSSLNLIADVTFLKNMPQGKYNLCVYITENEIIKPQKNNDPTLGTTPNILDYHHQHALRALISPNWGDEIINGIPTNGLTISKTYLSFKLGKDWKPVDCNIVAYIYYADGPKQLQIIQAQEVKL
ncbi:MAG: hypothetical protein AUJ98_02905 [Bacteroidetes bacterium CG2_30_33_31]|nr:MAG: hypothetical protein AUJ98_02905 [Bacteroidetes bacterium CG2_30_33_31]